jgi:PPOX class probable F420-dependent enzyme
MKDTIPAEMHGQKYISLVSFRKNGVAVRTPVWFAEAGGNLYVMTGTHLGKYKRVRNNPRVTIAPCTIRGKVTGPEFPATARLLPPEEFTRVRKLINAKYWLARLPWIWRRTDVYLEITPGVEEAKAGER